MALGYKFDTLIGLGVDTKDVKKVESQLDSLYKKYASKKIDFGVSFGGASQKVSKYVTDLDTGLTRMKKSAKASADVFKEVDKEQNKAFSNIKQGTKDSDSGFAQLNKRMGTAISSTIEWTVAVGGLYAVINSIKDSVDFTTQFNTSLTEIAMVTGRTTEAVADLKEEYLDLADALKVSSLELANSAVQLYRQGLSAQEVNDRLGEISKTAKVAGLSVDSVTKFVTSGTNAMKVSAQEFNDVLLKVSSVSATDYQKLGEAFQKSATGFTNAGFSIEKAAGALATIQEVTQESSTSIGTSMKTILARFNKLTDTGEDNTKTLNDIDKALQTVGLTLRGFDGQLRPTAEVLDDLAEKWDTLSINEQAYLGSTIAGVRQIERFRVLMENYGRAINITEQAYKSAGTTQEQYLKFQESIQGSLNDLTVSWEKLYDSLLDEGTIQGVIEFLKSLVDGMTQLNDSIGLINIAILALVTYLTLAKTGFRTMAFEIIPQFITNIVLGQGALNGLNASLIATRLSAIALQATMTLGLSVAIMGIVALISKVVKLHKDWEERLDNSNTKIEKLKNEIDDLNSRKVDLEVNAPDSQELQVLSKELEIKKELLNIEKQRNAIFLSETVPAIEETTDAILDQASAYEKVQNAGYGKYSSQITPTAFSLSDDASESKNLVSDIKLINDEVEKYTKIQINANQSTEEGRKEFELASDVLIDLKEKQANYNQEALNFYKQATKNSDAWKIDSVRNYALALADVLELEKSTAWEDGWQARFEAYQETEKLTASTMNLSDALMELKVNGELSDSMLENVTSNQNILNQVMGMSEEQLYLLAKQWGISYEKMSEFNEVLTNKALAESRARLEILRNEQKALAGMANNPEARAYAEMINDEIGSAMNQLNKYTERLDFDIAGVAKASEKATSSATSSTKKATEAVEEYSNELKRLNELQYEYDMLVNQGASEDDRIAKIKEIQSELQRVNDARRAELELMKANLSTLESQLSTQKEGTEAWTVTWNAIQSSKKEIDDLDSTIKSTSKEWWTWRDALKSINEEIEEAKENQLELFKDTVEEGIQSDIDALERERDAQKDLYKDKIDAIDDTIDSLKEEREIQEAIEKIQEKQIELLKAQNVLEDVKKERNTKVLIDGEWQWIANPSDVQKAQEDVDKITDSLQDMQEQKAFDDRIRELEKDKEFYADKQDIIEDAYNSELDVLQNALDTFKDIEADNYADRLQAVNDFVDEYMNTLSELNYINSSTTSVSRSSGSSSGSSSDSKSFGTQSSAESKAYYDSLKESTGGNKELMDKAEIARTEAVIASRKASGQSTSDQETWLKKLKSGTAQYEFGGDKKGDGLAYLHNREGVLTPDMNYAFKSLVSSITGTKMPNIPLMPMNQNINSGKSYTINGGLKIVAPNGANLKNLLEQATMLVDFR